jgi:hypothetical protein
VQRHEDGAVCDRDGLEWIAAGGGIVGAWDHGARLLRERRDKAGKKLPWGGQLLRHHRPVCGRCGLALLSLRTQ